MTYALMVILFFFGITLGRLSVIEKREKETQIQLIEIPENDLKQFDNINREQPKYGEYK